MTKVIGIKGGGNSVKNTGSLHSWQIFFFNYVVVCFFWVIPRRLEFIDR